MMEISRGVIAEKLNVRQGANGSYDLRLLQQSEDALLIEVSLSFYFQFIPNGADQNITWSQTEQDFFIQEWVRQVPTAWNKQNYITINGFQVSLAFNCAVSQESNNTQWQANVMKLKSRTAFRTSAVCLNCYEGNYDTKFDSNDDLQKPGGRGQTAIIHEFGHMLGLPDEYKESSTHYEDKNSIMNLGAEVRDRHFIHFVNWAKPHIDDFSNGPKEALALMETTNWIIVKALKRITVANTKEAEIAAVKAWRDGEGSDEGVHFVVHRRGTTIEIPYEEISPESFETLEVEFSSADDEEGEVLVWEPKSWEALEIFFVE